MVARAKTKTARGKRPAEDEEDDKPVRVRRTTAKEEPSPRGRREEPEDDDDDDKPRGRRSSRDEEPEDDDDGRANNRRSRSADEEDDDKPRGRRGRNADPEEDADEEPKSRGRLAKGDPEDDDDKPRGRRGKAADDDDEDDKPRRGRSRDDDDDDRDTARKAGSDKGLSAGALQEDVAKHETMMKKSLDLADELKKGLKIDRDDLDTEIMMQADIYYRVSEEYTLSVSRRDEAKAMLKRQEGMAYERLRKSLTEEGDDKKAPKRPSEPRIDANMVNDTMVAMYDVRVRKWSYVVERWEGLRESFKQRSFLLKEMANLFISNYWTENSGGKQRGEASSRKADQVKEDQAKSRDGYRRTRDDAEDDDDRGSKRTSRRSREDDED